MTNEDSIFNAALDLLSKLHTDIADRKVITTAYNVDRQRRKFVYRIEVEEPFEPRS